MSTAMSRPSALSISSSSHWTRLLPEEAEAFTARLLSSKASYLQFPYWNESYRPYLEPVYLVLGTPVPSAYVCVLTFHVPGMRLGLIQRGPVSLTGEPVSLQALSQLSDWAREHRYAFLRFTHHDSTLLDAVRAVGPCEDRDLFPLYRDSTAGDAEFIIDQKQSDQEMLAGFDREARRKIRRATEVGYELRSGDTPDRLEEAWSAFLQCSERKSFTFHKPLSTYLDMVRRARKYNCVRIYSAWLNGVPVQANFVLRDRDTAFCLLAGLDLDALQGSPTPSALVHWIAMRDLYRLGNIYYNLGCAEGGVEHFKSQFHPRKLEYPPALTLITAPSLFRVWETMLPLTMRVGLPLRNLIETASKKVHSFSKRSSALGNQAAKQIQDKNPPFSPGTLVEILGPKEIAATLDKDGLCEGLPFMPEMLQFCGRRFRVSKSAHKTCEGGLRRMNKTVHLANLRCHGTHHDGCQALCTIFWKEQWLRHADSNDEAVISHVSDQDLEVLRQKLVVKRETAAGPRYVCQGQALCSFKPLRWYNFSQYVADISAGNVGKREIAATLAGARNYAASFFLTAINRLRRRKSKPASKPLNLQPGDYVRVRKMSEIVSTFDMNRNVRGLHFSVDMLHYCGQEFRVARRIERLIVADTAEMRNLRNECIILENVTCSGNCSFCPRDLYHFWREDWLELVRRADTSATPDTHTTGQQQCRPAC